MSDYPGFMLVKNVDESEPSVTCRLSDYDKLRKDSEVLKEIKALSTSLKFIQSSVHKEPFSNQLKGGEIFIDNTQKELDEFFRAFRRLLDK